MRRDPRDLPASARRFLRTPEGEGLEPLVRRFHQWLVGQNIELTMLRASDVERFLARLPRKRARPRMVRIHKRGLIRYLDWQFRQGAIGFDPRGLGIWRSLSPSALAFVRSLEPTLKTKTCAGYLRSIRNFHEWIEGSSIELRQIDRPHMERWFRALNDRGLCPGTRIEYIQNVRSYLRWLHEREELDRHPEDLIRRSDFPKRPSYLPRPLPPDVDLALQKRWESSENPISHGFLLMRHTGLRVGELLALKLDCTRCDPAGHSFLEVPLGKLNNERLVPLSEKTLRVIQKLQEFGSQSRAYLLEKSPGKKATYHDVLRILTETRRELKLGTKVTSHQLRHTYATSLLNGGMSLVGIMQLLGHRDYRMTLRYAAITQEAIGREYFDALGRLQSKYGLEATAPVPLKDIDPVQLLGEVIAWTQKNLGHEKASQRLALSLVKRLRRVQADLRTALDREAS